MKLELRIEDNQRDDDIRDLLNWLVAEDDLRGRVELVHGPPMPHHLGSSFEVLAVAIGFGSATALVTVVITWLRTRTSDLTIRISLAGDRTVDLRSARVRHLDAPSLARLVGEVTRELESVGNPPIRPPATPSAEEGRTRGRMGSVDVLVVAALRAEFDAALEVMGGAWTEQDAGGVTPYLIGEYKTAGGGRLTVALARPTAMGPRRTAPTVTTLTDLLQPTCLAMSGVCAGNPDDTAAGDVVVAAQAYQWDEGKQVGRKFRADQQQYPLNDRWLRAAQDFKPDGLPSFGVASEDEAAVWLLERLHRGQDPRNHPARRRYFPKGTWSERLARLQADGLVDWQTEGWKLTVVGAATITRILNDPDGPDRLPFAVHAGPMASGGKVIEDPKIWAKLKDMGVRKILALEMEAATIATVAHEREVPQWLVAKGVMDHANFDKDDRFKEFAARASAEVLFALLGELLDGMPPAPTAAGYPGAVKIAFSQRLSHDWQDLADLVGIPGFDRLRFARGNEARAVWEWLEVRNRLGELPAALEEIGRTDLANVLRSSV